MQDREFIPDTRFFILRKRTESLQTAGCCYSNEVWKTGFSIPL